MSSERDERLEELIVQLLLFVRDLKTSDVCLQCRTSSTIQTHTRMCKELLRLKVRHKIANDQEAQLHDALRLNEPLKGDS